MLLLRLLAATLFFTLLAFVADAQTPQKSGGHDPSGMIRAGDLLLSKPWTRATPKSAPTGAGFVTITNTGATADRLVSVRTLIAARAEIHLSSMKDGVMSMRKMAEGVEIPSGGAVTLAPGGLHMMFFGLKNPIIKGKSVPVTLVFERAGEVAIELHAASLGARALEHKHAQ